MPRLRIDVITIFPGMFAPVVEESIIKRAVQKGKVDIRVHDLRDFTHDRHRKVDDRPFGGGSGMVMGPQPIFSCVEYIRKSAAHKGKVIVLSPAGKKLDQKMALKLSKEKELILICGRYEGIDERVRQHLATHEVSIGDYVLTGGELPAMVLIDSVVRLVPGVLGDKNSLKFESFEGNLLEYPQYTRPAIFKGFRVPRVLLSGDHHKIEVWRKKESLRRTRLRRPDLTLRRS